MRKALVIEDNGAEAAKRVLKEICPGAKTLGLDAVRLAKLRRG